MLKITELPAIAFAKGDMAGRPRSAASISLRDSKKPPSRDEGFCSANQPFGLVIASALVVAVPPIGTACRYSIAIQPAAPATVIPVRV